MAETLSKLKTSLDGINAQYALRIGDSAIPLNERLGSSIQILFSGKIFCTACGRKTSKSYSQGHCFPCSQRLASCDMCIVRPERCHYHLGTCREPDWGLKHCFKPHVIYLSNTTGLKVGITRQVQIPTRWLDQGAIQALPLFRVTSRFHAGLVEVAIAKHVADKTNWRALLKGDAEEKNMREEAISLLDRAKIDILEASKGFEDDLERIDEPAQVFLYPVLQYPDKIKSLNPEKNPEVSGTLLGIKGQYLILDTGVINIRKFTGYEIESFS